MNRGRNESSYKKGQRRRLCRILSGGVLSAGILVSTLTSTFFSTNLILGQINNFKDSSTEFEITIYNTNQSKNDMKTTVFSKLNVVDREKGENDPTLVSLLSKVNKPHPIHQRYNFYKWDDPNGVNINSVISYLKWFATHGLQSKENFNYNNFPLLPMMLKKNPQNNLIEVRWSLAAMRKHSTWIHFYKDRVNPMLKFIKVTLENRLNQDDENHNVHTRLYQVFRKGTEIPVLFEISDEHVCSADYSPILNPVYNHTFTKVGIIPIFSLAMKVNCNFTFSVPNYLAIRQAKQNSSEWDKYFERSANEYPWERKASAAVWRGTMDKPSRKFNRKWLVNYAKNTTVTRKAADGRSEQSLLIDAELANKLRTTSQIPFEDFQKYKAIIDIDGKGWSGRFQRLLCMNSVVVKFQPSALEYNSAKTLVPWIHYIPADSDTLGKNVKFAVDKKNKDAVKQIISNAHQWCRNHFTLERMADDLLDILSSYVEELDRGDSNWEQIWKESSIDLSEKRMDYKQI
ncbi:hypothetical protein CTEN210_01007 [Chaetoceros tenuissimus]|uniref:Glycosyl transferase CAP10 domain-containing protein n=1 Tax=Chaetoceros tenuissimus TaxID=426638 RepID=A0AAD3CF80_9STRA|nr:hypothetical protein CTEN210_01007 [Chaetoceros tenuissimus]